MREDESVLTKAIIDLATEYGRYGYRRVTALLHRQGWQVNHKRVERIWRREGLKVPQKQPKRARLWLNDGSCIRLRATHPNHVWSYDFVMDRTHNGKAYRMLTVIDEFTVNRKLKCPLFRILKCPLVDKEMAVSIILCISPYLATVSVSLQAHVPTTLPCASLSTGNSPP